MTRTPRRPPGSRWLSAALVGLALLAIGGCGRSGDEPNPVKAAVQRLGGDPNQLYQQTVIFKKLGDENYDQQEVALVQTKDGKTFQIVDSHGRVYRDYEDFLRNNQLPD